MKEQKRKPNVFLAFSTVFMLLALIFYSVVTETSSVPMLIIATGWCVIVGYTCGYKWDELYKAMIDRLVGLLDVILIIFSIGIFVAAMMYSGTIPTLIYYLVEVINPSFMIVLSFIIPALVSLAIGTSWGTAGTIGIVMISIASSMGVNMAMVAGAVISGTHVGQILSPMSDTSNVAANFAKTDTMSMIKRMAIYSVPVVLIAIVVYTVLGFSGGTSTVDLSSIQTIRAEISTVFNVSPIAILPMLLVFVLTFKKKPIVSTLIISSLVAIVLGYVLNGFDIALGLNSLYSGFNVTTIAGVDTSKFSEVFVNLVNRGGVTSMIGSVTLAIVATCYGGLMTHMKCVDVIAETLFSKVKSRIGLVTSTVVVAFMVVALTTSSYLATLISSDLFREKFLQFGMDEKDLIASGMAASSQAVTLIPWVDTAIYLSGVTGVPTLTSLPYNIFCWGNMVMVIVMSIFGIGFKDKKKNAEVAA